MNTLLKIATMVLCAVGVATAQNFPDRAQLLVKPRDITNDNPVRSMACFNYYIPLMNDITDEYEKSYAACMDNTNEERRNVDENTRSENKQLESCAQNSCNSLNECNTHENSIEYLECYVKGGNENSKAMYAIAANASEVLTKVREEYRLIKNEEYRCTNKSERIYVENSAKTYNDMQNCLQGKIPVPESTPTSVPVTTESSEITDDVTEGASSKSSENRSTESAETEKSESKESEGKESQSNETESKASESKESKSNETEDSESSEGGK